MASEGFSAAFKSRDFTALWMGQSFSRLGDYTMSTMMPLIVYSITGSSLTMSTVMALMFGSQVILLPFTGILVDHVSRIKLMIVSDMTRLIFLIDMIAFSQLGNLKEEIIYVYAIISGVMTAVFQPAYSAIRAQIFTKDIRNSANSLTQISEQVAMLVGPSLGAVVISMTSASIGFGINALTFLVSVVSLLFLDNNQLSQNMSTIVYSITFLKSELIDGYRELKKSTWLWVTICVFAFINIIGTSFISILLPWFVKVDLKLPYYTYGLLVTASGVGSILFAVIFSLRKKWKRRGVLVYSSYLIVAVALIGVPFVRWLPYIIFFMILRGAVTMMFGLIWEGSLQELVSVESFGKVSSLDMMGSYALLPIGYLVTGILSQNIGAALTIFYEAIFLFIVTLIPLFIPDIRKFD
ncbi:MFS transporter [Clostridium sp. LBM24168]